MIRVIRRTQIDAATPEDVFTALSDPKELTQLLPRVRKVEMIERKETTARLVTHMALGGLFGTLRCEGNLQWVEPREIVFDVVKPMPVRTRWLLVPNATGTELQATMELDLTPLLGPMAQFVPTNAVSDMIASELETALKSIRTRMGASVRRERIAA